MGIAGPVLLWLAIAGNIAVGSVSSVGVPISSVAGVYNPVTLGTTTVTVGSTTAGAAAITAAEYLLAAKLLLDAGVYVGALAVCSVQ